MLMIVDTSSESMFEISLRSASTLHFGSGVVEAAVTPDSNHVQVSQMMKNSAEEILREIHAWSPENIRRCLQEFLLVQFGIPN